MSIRLKKLSYLSLFHIVITFALTFLVGFLEPIGAMTMYGMKVLGIFLGMLYGWIALDMA